MGVQKKYDEYDIYKYGQIVAQGYKQVNFDETFALVPRLESIRILLTITCFMKFKLYHMDVKLNF